MAIFSTLIGALSSPLAQAGSFAHCQDPINRRPMTVLEAALWGPVYSASNYEHSKERFEQLAQSTAKDNPRDFSLETKARARSLDYLLRLEEESLFFHAESVAQMIWEIFDEKSPMGSIYRLNAEAIPRETSSLVCANSCPQEVRERLRIKVAASVAKFKTANLPRRGFAEVANDLNTNREGLISFLQAIRTERGSAWEVAHDYQKHLIFLSSDGIGRLWSTEKGRMALGLPATPSKIAACALREDCDIKTKQVFTPHDVRDLAREFYQQFLFRARSYNIWALQANQQKVIDSLIVDTYRYYPMAVAHVAAEGSKWAHLHCNYLYLLLQTQGEELSSRMTVRETMRLAPMATFWLIGTGGATLSGLIRVGKSGSLRSSGRGAIGIPALTFVVVGALQLADLYMRTAELSEDYKKIQKARLGALSGQLDEVVWRNYFTSREQYDEDRSSRDYLALDQALTLSASFIAARAFVYGFRAAFTGKLAGARVANFRYRKGIEEFLSKRKLRSAEQIDDFLKRATPSEIALIKKMLRKEFNFTVPAVAIALKEVLWVASDMPTGYDWQSRARGL